MSNKNFWSSLIIGLIFLFVVIHIEKSQFINLPISSPISYLPNGDWGEISYITRTYRGDYYKEFILRKETNAYGKKGNHSFDTPIDVVNYFNDYLLNNGWEIAKKNPFYLCQFGLPEKEYTDEIFMVEYIRPGDDPYDGDERVCVATIPYAYMPEQAPRFRVMLITLKKSPLTMLLEFLRE